MEWKTYRDKKDNGAILKASEWQNIEENRNSLFYGCNKAENFLIIPKRDEDPGIVYYDSDGCINYFKENDMIIYQCEYDNEECGWDAYGMISRSIFDEYYEEIVDDTIDNI